MTDTEFYCLNQIRAAMKDYLRWEWSLTDPDYTCIHDAMWFICDRMWDEVCARPVLPILWDEELRYA